MRSAWRRNTKEPGVEDKTGKYAPVRERFHRYIVQTVQGEALAPSVTE
ncbi:hypothetical protein [Hymenobacter sediminis]|nr:hypothetical protein [Hymenobacter sediminis]